MMGLSLLLAALATGGADPCAPVEAPLAPDAAAARGYLAVGKAEEKRGALDTASLAYREAARRDGGKAKSPARKALSRLCRKGQDAEPFEQGLAALRQGNKAEAAELFKQAREDEPEPATALLEGVARFELGQDAAARPLFEEAAEDPRLASEAALFLGLLALRRGEGREAASRFEAVARSSAPGLREPAESLLSVARREGRFQLSVLAGAGVDSNADLAPDGSSTAGGDADGAALVAASLVYAPFPESGPYLRASGSYRKLFKLTDFDLGAAQLAAGAQLGGPTHLRGEYAFELAALGGAHYLTAHRLAGEARLDLGPAAVSLLYAGRFESYVTDAARPYSGVRHGAELQVELRPWSRLSVGAAVALGRDFADDDTLSYLEGGPRAFARLSVLPKLRFDLDVGFTTRGYDAFDPALKVTRSDQAVEVATGGELDVDRFTVRVAVGLRRAVSNVPAFQYAQLTAGLSVGYAIGLP